MEKSKNQQQNPNKKIKTKGSVYIPGGLRDVLMGSSKETKQNKS